MRSWLLLGTLVLATAQATERPDPADEVRELVIALKNNDAASAILAMHGDNVLSAMLSAESPEHVDERVAASQGEEWVEVWTWLRTENIDAASSVLYPRWQAELPKALASAQLGLGMAGMRLAEDKTFSVDERAQLTELAFAANAWIARTDFLDKRTFDRGLSELSRWVSLANVENPIELELATPEQRVELAKEALLSAKRVAALYGVDVDAVLDTVKVTSELDGDDRAIRRISLRVFDVPIQISEELEWMDVPEEAFPLWEDGWMPTERAQMIRSMQETPVMPSEEAGTTAQDLTNTGCSVPAE